MFKFSSTSFLNFSSAFCPSVFSNADLYSGTHAHWGTVSLVCSTDKKDIAEKALKDAGAMEIKSSGK